jgi:hypothetical protein
MTKTCTLTPLQSYYQILTLTPQQTAASSTPLHRYVHNAVTDNDPHVPTWQQHHGAQQVKDDP